MNQWLQGDALSLISSPISIKELLEDTRYSEIKDSHRRALADKPCERDGCSNFIPKQKLRTNPKQRFCSPGCANAARGNDFYRRFSKAGNDAQNTLAKQLGERPGQANRTAALKSYHKSKPRTELQRKA